MKILTLAHGQTLWRPLRSLRPFESIMLNSSLAVGRKLSTFLCTRDNTMTR